MLLDTKNTYIVHCPTLQDSNFLLSVTNSPHNFEGYPQPYGKNTCYRVKNGVLKGFGSKTYYKQKGYSILSLEEFLSKSQPTKINTILPGTYIHCDTKEQWEVIGEALARDGYRSVDYVWNLSESHYIVTTDSYHAYWGFMKDIEEEPVQEFSDLVAQDFSVTQKGAQEDYLFDLTPNDIYNILLNCYGIEEEFSYKYHPRQKLENKDFDAVAKIEVITNENQYDFVLRDFRISTQTKEIRNSDANKNYRQYLYTKYGEKYLDDYYAIACGLSRQEQAVREAEAALNEAKKNLQFVKEDISKRKEEFKENLNQQLLSR